MNHTAQELIAAMQMLENPEQRISMVSTMALLKAHDPSYTLRYAKHHLHHPHDLMHKAVGWLLREMGKHCGMDELHTFPAIKKYARKKHCYILTK